MPGNLPKPLTESESILKHRTTGREILLHLFLRLAAFLVIAAGILYLADYLVLRVRMAANAHPFGTVTVRPYYAVPKKNRSIEYMFEDPRDEQCVNSLLPHVGQSACWYLRRHKERRINI